MLLILFEMKIFGQIYVRRVPHFRPIRAWLETLDQFNPHLSNNFLSINALLAHGQQLLAILLAPNQRLTSIPSTSL